MEEFLRLLLAAAGIAFGHRIEHSPEARASRLSHVAAGKTEAFEIPSISGQTTKLKFFSDGNAHFQIFVYDEFDRIVAQSGKPGSNCQLVWMASDDTTFTVNVYNAGDTENAYTAMVY